MGKSYNCGFRDKKYFDNKKGSSRKGNKQKWSDDDNNYSDYKIKHFKN